MYLFKPKAQFRVEDGEPDEPVWVQDTLLCDYCGNIIGEGEWGRRLECVYQIYEVGGAEPQFHEERFKVNGKNVDLYELYKTHHRFHYCQDWATEEFCDQRLMIEWMAALCGGPKSKDPITKVLAQPVKEFLTAQGLGEMLSARYAHRMILASAMYLARHRAIQKMAKTYTPEQLRLVLDEID